jgi:hypothetical protein
MKKLLCLHPQKTKLKRKKIKAPLVHASAYPLVACIFDFQNCWSPFLAWANSWISDLGEIV